MPQGSADGQPRFPGRPRGNGEFYEVFSAAGTKSAEGAISPPGTPAKGGKPANDSESHDFFGFPRAVRQDTQANEYAGKSFVDMLDALKAEHERRLEELRSEAASLRLQLLMAEARLRGRAKHRKRPQSQEQTQRLQKKRGSAVAGSTEDPAEIPSDREDAAGQGGAAVPAPHEAAGTKRAFLSQHHSQTSSCDAAGAAPGFNGVLFDAAPSVSSQALATACAKSWLGVLRRPKTTDACFMQLAEEGHEDSETSPRSGAGKAPAANGTAKRTVCGIGGVQKPRCVPSDLELSDDMVPEKGKLQLPSPNMPGCLQDMSGDSFPSTPREKAEDPERKRDNTLKAERLQQGSTEVPDEDDLLRSESRAYSMLSGGDGGCYSGSLAACDSYEEEVIEEFAVKSEWNIPKLLSRSTVKAQLLASSASSTHQTDNETQLVLMADTFLRHFISFPGSHMRIAWDVVGALLIFYDLVMIPIKVFSPPETTTMVFMEWASLVFWTLNVYASMTVGFVQDGVTIMVPRKIFYNYFRTWFIFDCMTVIPDWASSLVGSSRGSSVRVLRIFRLFRSMRLLRLFRLRWILAHINEFVVDSEHMSIVLNIVKMIMLLLAINHLIACGWYGIGLLQMDHTDTWITVHQFEVGVDCDWVYTYFTSFHWSVTQFTPASMHVQPQNVPERIFAVAVVVFALVGFSYVVGSITGSLAQLRSIQEDASKQFWSVRRYLRQNQVPVTLSLRIQKYLEHAWNKHKDRVNLSNIKLFSLLSEQLHNELKLSMSVPHLTVHPLFHHLNEISCVTMHRLATSAISRKLLARNDSLFFPGEMATHMYFVVQGRLQYLRYLVSGQEKKEWVDRGEDWISEPVLWVSSWVHIGVLVAATECELLLVQSAAFSDVVRLNPQVLTVSSAYACRYVQYLNSQDNDMLSDITQGEHESVKIQGFIDLEDRPSLRGFFQRTQSMGDA